MADTDVLEASAVHDRRATTVTHRIYLFTIAFALTAFGCVRHFEGTVAELEMSPDVAVVMTASTYGDCFRDPEEVPVVYTVRRPKYALRIAHGMAYYPEFFLIAYDDNGGVLNIRGDGIQPIVYPWGEDMGRLREARGTDFSHHAMLDVPQGWDSRIRQDLTVKAVREGRIGIQTLAFDVQDSAGHVIAHEQLRYRVSTVQCIGVG